MADILDLVGDLIVQVQQEKKERYDTCGCAICNLRSNDIDVWLNSNKVVKVPDDIYDEAPCQNQTVATIAPISTHQAWLCHSCLRRVSASSGRCPYCGTKGLC